MSYAPFDPCGVLPSVTSGIEASAGTGKTYALAGLASRLIAEGAVTADGLLMVTFTRAATGELRSRVRDRLVETAAHLRDAAERPVATDDPLLEWLVSASAGGGSIRDRVARLDRAVTEFDSATITTIHGFAHQVLAGLGLSSGIDRDVRFVDDLNDLILEVCTDLLSSFAVDDLGGGKLPSWTSLSEKVRTALQSPDTRVVPASETTEGVTPDQRLLATLVRTAVARIGERRIERGTQSFDGLLTRLRDALASRGRSDGTLASIRRSYQVALIDEFQDTDPIQWLIFQTLFGSPGGSSDSNAQFVLVGDPKQAIYSFRGADIPTYVEAIGTADRRSLDVNWRSNGAVVQAIDRLFSDVVFGTGIQFQPVEVAEVHRDERARWTDGREVPALQIRCATGPGLRSKAELSAQDAKDAVFADLTEHAIALLDSGRVPNRAAEGPLGQRAVRPSDIAVLVRSNADAQAVQTALLDCDVPAVLSRGASVLDSPAAMQMRWLLDAMVRPSDERRARTYAVSWFGGHDASWLVDVDESGLLPLQDQLHDWNAVATTKGVVELMAAIWSDTGVVQRLLGRPGGVRAVTDLEHLGELLHLSVGDGPASAAGLLAVLDGEATAREGAPDTDIDTDVASRRIESDADAVQVMTVWVAKGLQFPIVLCPTMWTGVKGSRLFHEDGETVRSFDVTTSGAGWPDSAASTRRDRQIAAERTAEELRLLYVALTRAQHHTAVWWARYQLSSSSALCRVLFGRRDDGSIDPDRFTFDPDEFVDMAKDDQPLPEETVGRLESLADRSGGAISVVEHGGVPDRPSTWSDPGLSEDQPRLVAAEFDRTLRRARSRWSFTAIKARDDDHLNPWDLSRGEEASDDEQRPPDAGLDTEPPVLPHPPSPDIEESSLAWLPAGASFGTLVHEVLEDVDFTEPDLATHVTEVVTDQMGWRALSLRPIGPVVEGQPVGGAGDELDEAEGARRLAAGLVEVIETPLGPSFDGRRLRDIGAGDCLDEMGFELPLNSDGGSASTVADIGRLLTERLPADDPYRPWADALADGTIKVHLDGHLTGSIDAVIRVNGRFLVVDYKSNRLHEHGRPPGPGDYGADSMRASMFQHEYPLQALLYQVAVHRYLRWRQPGYAPETHLGGIAYLYVRGMTGNSVRTVDGAPDGVCTWRVPGSVVQALSDLLDGVDSGGSR